MAMGARENEQQELWVATQDLPKSPGHPFYERLNRILSEAGFDRKVESWCEPYYAKAGRPSIPPGVYFRMLLIGYFEGIGSQRGIAWRCQDSLSLKSFLGMGVTGSSPDHSSLTYIRKRLPLEVHQRVFVFVLEIAEKKGLLKGRTVAVDATTLEANAAMKTIIHKHTGEDWKEYLERLAKEEGIEDPSDEDLRRYDRKRKDKKVSNQEWASPTDHDSRITKMKDGRTHLAYKAEHAVDVDSDIVVSAAVYHADEGDASTLLPTVVEAQVNLTLSGSGAEIEDVVADKGYHKTETLVELENWGLRTYIPEKRKIRRRKWNDKPERHQAVYRANCRRTKGKRGKALQRKRSELPERSFAHICETGGARRTWLRGLRDINKRYLIQVAARNLGVILRQLCGVGTPRSLQKQANTIKPAFLGPVWVRLRLWWTWVFPIRPIADLLESRWLTETSRFQALKLMTSSTGC